MRGTLMNRIALIIPYFGTLPNYFHYGLKLHPIIGTLIFFFSLIVILQNIPSLIMSNVFK